MLYSQGQLPATYYSKLIPHCSCQRFPVLGIGTISAFLQSSTTVPSSHTSFIAMRSPSYISNLVAQVVSQTSPSALPFHKTCTISSSEGGLSKSHSVGQLYRHFGQPHPHKLKCSHHLALTSSRLLHFPSR